MASSSFVLLLVLAALAAGSPVLNTKLGNTRDSYTLPKNLKPTHYDVEFTLNSFPRWFDFMSTVKIEVHVLERTNTIVLHSKNLQFDEDQLFVYLKSNENFGSMFDFYATSITFDAALEIVTITLNRSLEKDSDYLIEIMSQGELSEDEDGAYRSSFTYHGAQEWMIKTQFKPTGARRVFPCFDDPSLQATFDLNIYHRDSLQAKSNLPVRRTFDRFSMVTTYFETSPLMSIQDLSFTVADFKRFENKD